MKVFNLSSAFVFLVLVSSSCTDIFGRKDDDTVDEIFNEGEIDPNLVPQNVGYVPIQPVWDFFSNPVDVFVGYDEMVYVVDDKGVNVLDLKGQLHATIPIKGATEVIQDRRLHLYVIGKVTVNIQNKEQELSAIYRLSNSAGIGSVVYEDTLIHPFCDVSRNNTSFRTEDLQVEFTGLTALANNTLYVSRTGIRNSTTSTSRPDNTILIFDKDGVNIGYASGLNPTVSSLKSAINIGGIANMGIAPPQKAFGFSESEDFIYTQKGTLENPAEFGVLAINVINDPEAGKKYNQSNTFLDFDTDKADRFLYEPNRFKSPEDIFISPDRFHIFVVDSELDSLYQFTIQGEEGVNPPANSTVKKQIIVSFGGKGEGPFQFNSPSGVCSFRRIVYVADKGNNRVVRFQLNTDLE